jgi:hypothetical protein
MKRIEIAGSYADLSEAPIGINYQYLDVTDPSARFTPFSSSIVLPFTARNKKIMGFGDVTGGSMTAIRNIPEVNFWFGHNKVVKNGYLKVTSIGEKGYNCNITGRNTDIEALEAHTFTEIFDECADGFTDVLFADAIAQLESGYSALYNKGWILPRTMPDSISGASWTIYSLTNGYQHELWVNAAAIIQAMEDLGWMTLKVWEGDAKVDWDSSDLITDLRKLYTPAWNYHLAHPSTWQIVKVATGARIIDGKTIDKALMANFGGKNPWDFIKYLSHLFCASIYQDGTEFTLIPFNNLTDTGAVNLTNKLVGYSKYPNIPKYEANNFIGYKLTDNLPETYGRFTLTSPVTPLTDKNLFTFDLMLPGQYNTLNSLFNTGYTVNSDLTSSPLFLFDDETGTARAVKFEATPSNFDDVATLKNLTYYNFSVHYSGLQALATKGLYYDADLALNPYDFLRLSPFKLIRINELGGLFYLNKISNFDPYSGKTAKCQIIKW